MVSSVRPQYEHPTLPKVRYAHQKYLRFGGHTEHTENVGYRYGGRTELTKVSGTGIEIVLKLSKYFDKVLTQRNTRIYKIWHVYPTEHT